MVTQMTCVQLNCHLAIHAHTQTQTETRGFRMHFSDDYVQWTDIVVCLFLRQRGFKNTRLLLFCGQNCPKIVMLRSPVLRQ